MIKYKIDDLPLKTGHAARGMGVYTKNLINSVGSLVKQSEDFDLIHYPYFDLFFNTLKIDKSKKTIVTVPDVIPLIYPKHYPLGIKAKINLFLQKRQLKKADAIITISETSKKDIVWFLGVNANKIHVTYLAPNFNFKKVKVSSGEMSLPEKFVLYVGDINYNKNLITLVKACKKAKVKLVIVGKQATSAEYDKNHIENKDLKELQENYGNDKDIIRLGFLSDEDLNKVWNLATVYCQPSHYEGFGLGPLEAMQAGVPVVASHTQAMVEILSDACIYFEPKSTNDLVENIKVLMNSKSKREEYILKGKKQAKKYSWEKMAHEVVSIYKAVLQ